MDYYLGFESTLKFCGIATLVILIIYLVKSRNLDDIEFSRTFPNWLVLFVLFGVVLFVFLYPIINILGQLERITLEVIKSEGENGIIGLRISSLSASFFAFKSIYSLYKIYLGKSGFTTTDQEFDKLSEIVNQENNAKIDLT